MQLIMKNFCWIFCRDTCANPRWPLHAKFHNAQTIGLGTLLDAASLWFTWRAKRPADLGLAVAAGSAIYGSWIFAALVPGPRGPTRSS
jgi:hypothetical protein